MRRGLLTVSLALFAAAAGAAGCGPDKKVVAQVDALSNKVESMGQSLEQTQERVRQNEAKIAATDTKAGAAQQAADSAKAAANAADQHASAAASAASDANGKVDALGRRLVYTATLSEAQGGFEFNKSELPAAAKSKLDEIASKITSEPQGGYVDIEGHTDNKGTTEANEKVGMARATSVMKYLASKGVPLWRMNCVSYGADKPVGDNKTKDGRAQNRRVEIRVYTAGK